MGSLLLFLAIFPLSVLVTLVLLLVLGFLKPTDPPKDDHERLRGRAEHVEQDTARVRERSRRLERMLAAEEDLFNKGGGG